MVMGREFKGYRIMKYLLALLLLPSLALSETTCESLGLYSFALVGCPQQKLGVDTSVPLCDQSEWSHLAYLDSRCYYELPTFPECTDWDCPAPYDRYLIEPISGKIKIIPGSRELVDWYYRAARGSYAAASAEVRKLSKKKKR